jgi:prophage regulatory protein
MNAVTPLTTTGKPYTSQFHNPTANNPLMGVGYLRLPQIIGNPKATPPIPALIPISKSSWWKGVKEGRYPAAVKLGPRTTCWRIEDIRGLIASVGEV